MNSGFVLTIKACPYVIVNTKLNRFYIVTFYWNNVNFYLITQISNIETFSLLAINNFMILFYYQPSTLRV